MRPARAVLTACSRYRTRRLLIHTRHAPLSTRSPQGRALNSSLALDSYPPEHPSATPDAHLQKHSAVLQPTKDTRSSTTPLEQYQRLLESGTLRGDDHQTRIICKLQDLHDKLLHYSPPPISSPAPFTSIVSQTNIRRIFPHVPPDYKTPIPRAGHTVGTTLFRSQRPLPVRRRRDRQDDAHGHLLPGSSLHHHAQTSRPFPRLYDRRPQAAARCQDCYGLSRWRPNSSGSERPCSRSQRIML